MSYCVSRTLLRMRLTVGVRRVYGCASCLWVCVVSMGVRRVYGCASCLWVCVVSMGVRRVYGCASCVAWEWPVSRYITHDTHPQSGAFSAAYDLHNTTCCHSTKLVSSSSSSWTSRIGPFDTVRLHSYSFSRQRFFGLPIVLLPCGL